MRIYMKMTPLMFIAILIPLISAANTGTIMTVHSGDLIEFEGGFTVKLLGIRTPDKSTKLGYQVYDFTKLELEGKVVKLFTYTTNNMASGIVYGDEGHPFAQIVYGKGLNSRDWSVNFNELLLRRGYAIVDNKYLPEELRHFIDIEKTARAQKLGIWKNERTVK